MGTKIQITGTKGELLAALRIMQYYETDCLMQFMDCDNPTGYEDYIDFIASRISSEEFCRLFRTTEGAIRATAIGNYLDVIWEFRAWAIPFDGRDYDNFMNMTDRACSLSKLEFEEAIKTMVGMGVKDYDTFMEEDYREEDHTSHFVYDPIMKRRISDRKTYCTAPTVAWLKQ